jgi:hypothetical protein
MLPLFLAGVAVTGLRQPVVAIEPDALAPRYSQAPFAYSVFD